MSTKSMASYKPAVLSNGSGSGRLVVGLNDLKGLFAT